MPPRKQSTSQGELPEAPKSSPSVEGDFGWDGENHKDGFHIGDLSEDDKQRNIAGVHAARAAMHGVAPEKAELGGEHAETTEAALQTDAIANPTTPTPTSREDITKKRMAISRLLASLVMPQNELSGMVINEAAIDAAEPSKLIKHLVGRGVIVADRNKGVGKQAVMYKKLDGKMQAVALSAKERKLFKYNIQAYADAPYIATKASDTYDADRDPTAPARAVYHSLDDSILPKMDTYVKTLLKRDKILRQFYEALGPGRYGLARMGNEASMRGNASVLFDQILPDALNAIGDQKQWTAEQAKLAYATIMHRVTATDARGKRDFNYTRRLVNMLRTHNTQKIALFQSSIDEGTLYSVLHHRIAEGEADGKVQ